MTTELEAAHRAGDWPTVTDLIDASWMDFFIHGKLGDLAGVVFDMPAAALETSPITGHLAELFTALPIGTIPIQVPTTPEAIAAMAESPDLRGFTERALLAIITRRIHGQNRAARALALATVPVLRRSSPVGLTRGAVSRPANNVTDLKTVFFLQAGLAAQLADDRPLALRLLQEGWREHEYDGTGYAARTVAVRLAVEAALSGEADESRRWLDRAEKSPSTDGMVHEVAAHGMELANMVLALDALGPGDAPGDAGAPIEVFAREEQWPFVAWASARHALLSADPERALDMLTQTRSFFPRLSQSDGIHRHLVAMAVAEAELALGNGTRAAAELAASESTTYFGRLTEARLALLAGENEQARATAAETASGPDLARRARIEAQLIQAVAAARLDLPDAAATSCRRAIGLLESGGPVSALLGLPRAAIEQLASTISGAEALREMRARLPEADIYPDSVELIRLSERELVVLRHLTNGLKRQALAREMYVSENTVKTHMRTLYAKLGVATREAAVSRAHELGLVPSP